MGAGIARRLVGDRVTVDSCGLETQGGLPATKRAIAVMEEIGIDISNHRARSIDEVNPAQYEVVIAMEPSIGESLRKRGVHPDRLRSLDVADPYGGTMELYRARRDEIISQLRHLFGLEPPQVGVNLNEP
jgi:protein-tyrosine-phosphatase